MAPNIIIQVHNYLFVRQLFPILLLGYSFSRITILPESLLLTETPNIPLKRDEIPLTLRIRASIAAALGAAAARAKLLADHEDREIEDLVAIIIETQVALFFFLFMVNIIPSNFSSYS